MKNILVAQSGGPTAVINATLAGVVERALISGEVCKIYGSLHGIKGVIDGNIIEIGQTLSSPDNLRLLAQTPASALGSCRYKLKPMADAPEDYKRIFDTFQKHNISCFVYIGGNDSMDTVQKLSAYAKEHNLAVSIMGAPKTVDNDLHGMDHSPGFSSAAKYISFTMSELWQDCCVYDIPAVTIVEIMGRHVGWLCASSALAHKTCAAPHLIYLPEIPFDDIRFIEDIREKLQEHRAVVVAVSEGIRYADGTYVSESSQSSTVDMFGHKALSGVCKALESLVRGQIGCKVRAIDLSLMQRSAAHLVSANDQMEARMLGATAMDRALRGISAQVPVLRRVSSDPYLVEYDCVPVEMVANLEKAVPREWINDRGNGVTAEMMEYLTPLVRGDIHCEIKDGLPQHLVLNP